MPINTGFDNNLGNKDFGDLTIEVVLPTEAFNLSSAQKDEIKAKIDLDRNLMQTIIEDTASINNRKKHWSQFTEEDWRGKSRISTKEYLKYNGLVEKNKQHQKKVWNRKWTESMKWSTDHEAMFIKDVGSIVTDKQIEVMKISTFSEKGLLRQSIAVGSGEYIQKTEIDKAIGDLSLSSIKPSKVFFVHNHYDEYQDLTLPIDYQSDDPELMDGIATTGGLSKADIEFADKFKSEMVDKGVNVYMVAVNERGLTFCYEAGTSEFRDWENDHE